MRRMATWSTPSLRAAFAMIGSMMAMPCMPPGELCALRGGVFVSTVTPRQRIACGWYSSETMRPDDGGIATVRRTDRCRRSRTCRGR